MAMEILTERKDLANGEVVRVFEVGDITIRWRRWRLYGGGDNYFCQGSRKDLLEAGVCEESWFPVAPKRLNDMIKIEGALWASARKRKGDQYDVYLYQCTNSPFAEQCQRLIESAMQPIQRGHLRLVWSALA